MALSITRNVMPSPKLSFFKRSNDIWYVAYSVNDRRVWKSTGCKDKRQALQILRTLDLSPAPKNHVPDNLNEFISEFLSYARSVYQKKTYELYANVGHRIAELAGSKRLQDINPKVWDDYALRRCSVVSSTTLNIEQRSLKSMMNKAVTWEYLSASPFAKVKNVRVEEIPPRYFTRKEFETLLSLIQEKWFLDVVLFAVLTGIRRGELVNLRWDDVDFTRREITIQGHDRFKVKGNKMRVVPLSSSAMCVTQRQTIVPGCPYVFNRNGDRLYPNWVTALFRRYLKKAGLWDKGF